MWLMSDKGIHSFRRFLCTIVYIHLFLCLPQLSRHFSIHNLPINIVFPHDNMFKLSQLYFIKFISHATHCFLVYLLFSVTTVTTHNHLSILCIKKCLLVVNALVHKKGT